MILGLRRALYVLTEQGIGEYWQEYLRTRKNYGTYTVLLENMGLSQSSKY